MQLTTLLDTVYQGVSTTGADDFDRLVADLIPCRTHDPELWFAEHTAQVEQAKALCRTCPVREGCLAGAIEREEPWGVWGGEVFVGLQVSASYGFLDAGFARSAP